ncbi:MAG: nucleotidyltransferase family protein [Candidatus Hadarchaeota archaeon]|nr:nucleotidyltransferase family protein [Candidatus Hadarchaeota archaeon]
MMERFEELREKILPVLLPCGVKRIALFGSVVRGEDTPESDVDILVKLKPPNERPPLGLFKWIALEDELSQKLGGKVDLVTEDGISPYIRPYVDREKVILYEE